MAIKDFDASENKESRKEQNVQQAPTEKPVEEPKAGPSSEVKNASATGDGSFGRSDELPDENEELKDNTY